MAATNSDIPTRYDSTGVEEKWIEYWMKKKLFSSSDDDPNKNFTIVIPPPNVTGQLHIGHAIDNSYQDTLIRRERMRGKNVCWVPGTDHAGIATQNVVERKLHSEGTSRHGLGKDKFLEEVWRWKKEKGGRIIEQLRRMGCGCDWDRERFTMDPEFSMRVKRVFISLYNDGLIYQALYPVNWCSRCNTALADDEVDHEKENGKLYHVDYRFDGSDGIITIATTRPETIFGDVAVAYNPSDERYNKLKGTFVIVPGVERKVPLIPDHYVDKEFGTGLVKITPAHDKNDFEVGNRHNLERLQVIDSSGKMTDAVPEEYRGLDRFECREKFVGWLRENGMMKEEEDIEHSLGHCYRCKTVVEPYLSDQWFVRMRPLVEKVIPKLDELEIHPPAQRKVLDHWLEDCHDWCISRQIWWGHRIPIWVHPDTGKKIVSAQPVPDYVQVDDVLDTWFSSWLWAFGVWKSDKELASRYPTSILITGKDILFFWVARMLMASAQFTDTLPFDKLFLHGIVRDEEGRKMSKSLGNVIDPLDIIEKYNADVLRFTLMAKAPYGNDLHLAPDTFNFGQTFCTKLWNIGRYCLMDNKVVEPDLPYRLDAIDRWMIGELRKAVGEVNSHLDNYHFAEAAMGIYHLAWETFANRYLEMAKFKKDSADTQRVLMYCLDVILRLLHPIMPFITEELSAMMRNRWTIPLKIGSILETEYPEVEIIPEIGESDHHIKWMWGLVSRIRTVKSDFDIPSNTDSLSVFITCDAASYQKFVEENPETVMRICRLKEVGIGIPNNPTDYISYDYDGWRLWVEKEEYMSPVNRLKQLAEREERLLAKISEQDRITEDKDSSMRQKAKAGKKVERWRRELNEVLALKTKFTW